MVAKRKRSSSRKTPAVEKATPGVGIKKGDRVYVPDSQQHGTVTHLVREKGKGVTAQVECDNGFRWFGAVEQLVVSSTESSVATSAADPAEVVEVPANA